MEHDGAQWRAHLGLPGAFMYHRSLGYIDAEIGFLAMREGGRWEETLESRPDDVVAEGCSLVLAFLP
jgi:hypothetical protein